jgi:hypothetical protein
MENKGVFTKILAVTGTVCTWLPIAAPVMLTVAFLIIMRFFRFDWLMPAELFVFLLIGGALLLWAAIRARSRIKIIAWGLGIAVVMLFAGQQLAVLTGLATGGIAAAGGWWMVVLATLIIYTLAVILTGIGGILLLKDLYPRKKSGRRPSGEGELKP